MTKLIRLIAWSMFIAIAVVTLGPINVRPQPGGPPGLQHFAAFVVTAMVFAAAYPKHAWLAFVGVLLAILGLEVLQNVVPGRHGRINDAMFKSAGALLGFGVSFVVQWAHRKYRARTQNYNIGQSSI